jgi:hypothetical protein
MWPTWGGLKVPAMIANRSLSSLLLTGLQKGKQTIHQFIQAFTSVDRDSINFLFGIPCHKLRQNSIAVLDIKFIPHDDVGLPQELWTIFLELMAENSISIQSFGIR